MHPSGVQRTTKVFRVLTGVRFPAELLRDIKRRITRLHAVFAKPLKNTSVFDKDNEGVVLSDQDDAFVFLR